ncbi:MAG: hypothetical protein AW12_00204 [Candidatus Accumulibacter sp. BA-94]|nr:MAG: hypothetical protein AW12_00204 [Candidatus Accumulibacter sp. BA-94]
MQAEMPAIESLLNQASRYSRSVASSGRPEFRNLEKMEASMRMAPKECAPTIGSALSPLRQGIAQLPDTSRALWRIMTKSSNWPKHAPKLCSKASDSRNPLSAQSAKGSSTATATDAAWPVPRPPQRRQMSDGPPSP